MAYQQADLDRLDQAIASGVRSVTFADGRRTEYQNTMDMLSARKVVAGEIAGATATGKRNRLIIGRVRRG